MAIIMTVQNSKNIPSDIPIPTGYATSERREGESPEQLAKTTEMCHPERK
jgi:hypothetical protein